MKHTLALLLAAGLPIVLAAPPADPAGASAAKGACTFSANEKANLGHNHDVNTGQILINGVIKKAPKIGGSGCSPAWAVGGAITDNTPTPTKNGIKKALA